MRERGISNEQNFIENAGSTRYLSKSKGKKDGEKSGRRKLDGGVGLV